MNKKKILIYLLCIFYFLFLFLYFVRFISNIYNNNNHYLNVDNILGNNKRTIIMIFAGRQKYLDILLIYLNYLYKNKKIHEIHFWQFTQNSKDIQYLESISNIHKTSSKFNEYKNIFPEIKENKFLIGIKSTKGGAYLLLNEKYEIIFNVNNTNYTIFADKIKNEIIKKESTKIPYDKYLFYTFEIVNHNLFVKEKNLILFQYTIEDDTFLSVKIHSENDSENFWDYKEMKNQNYKLFDSEYREREHWYEAYKFYLDYEFEILIKIDDDIIYIDVNRFDEYINFIRNKTVNITIPNLVNHAVSLFYNSKYGLIPNQILNESYINKKCSLDVYDYYKDGKQAKIIHKYFLNNIYKFINNHIEPINLTGQRPSICMFGIKKENFNHVYKTSLIEKLYKDENNKIDFHDEPYSYSLNNNYLFPKFVCMHYSFGSQMNNGLDEKLIFKYKKLISFKIRFF